MIGLFTRSQLKESHGGTRSVKNISLMDAPAEHLWKLGLKGVQGMNPDAKHPNMAPSGTDKPLLYVLGDAPGQEDDKGNEHFISRSGDFLRRQFPRGYEDYTRFNNCVRTRPIQDRPPNRIQIECFRPSVVEDIERTRPRAIWGAGKIPLDWALGDISSITIARGRRFPVRVGTHECWFYPVHAPDYIMRVESKEEKADGRESIPGKEWRNAFERDIARVFVELDDLPEPMPEHSEDFFTGVETLTDLPAIVRGLAEMAVGEFPTVDVETNCYRPYESGAKLLTMAVSTGKRTIAFPVDHPGQTWRPDERKALQQAIFSFLEAPAAKVAQNAAMELEWFLWLCGWDVMRTARWHDTMLEAWVLDQRVGGHNLNFLTALNCGFTIKDTGLRGLAKQGHEAHDLLQAIELQRRLDSESEVDRSFLEREPLQRVLLYNGLDAKYTRRVHTRQTVRVQDAGLWDVYLEQLRKVPSIVCAQAVGVPIDQNAAGRFADEYDKKISNAHAALMQCEPVKQYERKYGKFNPLSASKDVVILLRDVMGHTEGQRGNKYSTDEETLKAIGGEVPAAILGYRKSNKAKGTYVDPLVMASEDSVVYADGRVHTRYNQTIAETGRLSSEDPNLQNWPIRNKETKKLRTCFVPPESTLDFSPYLLALSEQEDDEMILLATDYGALEARCFGMVSKDPVLVDALWTDYDIHLEWAKRVIKVWPKTYNARYGKLPEAEALKAFRGDIKNQFVFPCFFGSTLRSVAGNLEADQDAIEPVYNEFWRTFKGVKKWQTQEERFYDKHFYVETLLGRRRLGPLSFNMLINTPVQGSAADLVGYAMNRLSMMAWERADPFLQWVFQIHDDLTFFVPKRRLNYYVDIIVKEMVSLPFNWVNVPMLVEVSAGPNWADKKEIGKFRSDTVKGALCPKRS